MKQSSFWIPDIISEKSHIVAKVEFGGGEEERVADQGLTFDPKNKPFVDVIFRV